MIFTKYRFVALKALKTADAPDTVSAIKCALEDDCELKDWNKKLVGLSADGAAVNIGARTGAAKGLQAEVSHLVPVHCCAHRVVYCFKTLEDTLHSLYLMHHRSPNAKVSLDNLVKFTKCTCSCQ